MLETGIVDRLIYETKRAEEANYREAAIVDVLRVNIGSVKNLLAIRDRLDRRSNSGYIDELEKDYERIIENLKGDYYFFDDMLSYIRKYPDDDAETLARRVMAESEYAYFTRCL